MRRFELTGELLGRTVTAEVLCLEGGIHVSIYGGDLPHIGAVSVVSPDGVCSTVEFPGHRDGAVSERWAKALSSAGYCPAVVEAGIHYDNLSRQGIADVLSLTDKMLDDTLGLLSKTPNASCSTVDGTLPVNAARTGSQSEPKSFLPFRTRRFRD